MPWAGFEPARLAALPPQDSVSTNSTTTAMIRDNPATTSDLRQMTCGSRYFGISEDLLPSAGGAAGDGAEEAGAAGFVSNGCGAVAGAAAIPD